MSYDGRAVANFVLDVCFATGRPITNLALQKIVFFCHVWSLIELERPLLKQKFEAWQHGPVLQHLYREFQGTGNSPIAGRATKIDPHTGARRLVEYAFDDQTASLLRRVIDFYSRMNASDLRNLSHAKDGPWDNAWNHKGSVNPGMKIDDEQILKFYSKARKPFSIQ